MSGLRIPDSALEFLTEAGLEEKARARMEQLYARLRTVLAVPGVDSELVDQAARAAAEIYPQALATQVLERKVNEARAQVFSGLQNLRAHVKRHPNRRAVLAALSEIETAARGKGTTR